MKNIEDGIAKKRIAKNTFALYFRTLLVMLVTLYTSRVVLGALGVNDFGIYDVVGSFVTIFSFINLSMTAATQRYLNYEMGNGSAEGLKRVFSTSMVIHIAIALLLFIICETGGLWFLKNKMIIPQERMTAAFWVYQFSIFTTMVSFVGIPYNAVIMAQERMGAFAYISIFEVCGRLAVVFALQLILLDKLIVYAILVFLLQVIIRLIFRGYSRKHFPESHYSFIWDKKLFKQMLSFCGWSMFGNFAHVCLTQGTNVLLNMFFTPAVNAAKGIATQVQFAVSSFCINVQVAFNPQIVKSYAAGDVLYSRNLIFLCSRVSFYIILMLSLPILFDTDLLLRFWLKKNIPEYAPIFVRLSMILCIFQALGNPLVTGNSATGNVRRLMVTVGVLFWTVIPFSYLGLKLGGPPQTVFWTQIGLMIIAHIIRIGIVGKQFGFTIVDYCKDTLWRVAAISIICFIPAYLLNSAIEEGIVRLILITGASVITVSALAFAIGLKKEERQNLKLFIIKKIERWKIPK